MCLWWRLLYVPHQLIINIQSCGPASPVSIPEPHDDRINRGVSLPVRRLLPVRQKVIKVHRITIEIIISLGIQLTHLFSRGVLCLRDNKININ